jgi:UDP-glucose:(heptosyl)LPS alpha-1,3-glucosyltransferase
VIERFTPTAGGVENVAWQVARELTRVGEEVTVITRHTRSETARGVECRDACEPHVTIEKVRVPRAWQPLRVIAFSHAAANAARRGAFDIVHSFSRTRHQDLYRAGGGSHNDYLRRTYSRTGGVLRRFSPRHRVLLSIEARVFGDPTQRIQCASRLVADALVAEHGVSPERILLLPNAVDADRYGAPAAFEAGRRLRARLDEKAERIWLFPASGWHRKGLPVLFEDLAKRHDPGLRLWIAGRDDEGPWRKKAAKLGILDRVRFLGVRDDLDAIYGAVDGMVLPTRYDAFANVTLEAAASGLPIITTRANGAAEWLADEVCMLESANDPLELARAFEPFLDVEWRRTLGERARKKARSLDWAQHVSVLREEYRRIVDARGEGSDR